MPCLSHVNEIFNLPFHLPCVLKHLQKFFEQIFSFQAINSSLCKEKAFRISSLNSFLPLVVLGIIKPVSLPFPRVVINRELGGVGGGIKQAIIAFKYWELSICDQQPSYFIYLFS